MYAVGLDVDTRAYFTAATCATSLYITLSVKTSPLFFSTNRNVHNLPKKMDHYNKTNLVLWNSRYRSVRIHQHQGILTKLSRNMFSLTYLDKSIFIGLLLSDAWIQKRPGWNPRIGFKQSFKHQKYFWFVFFHVSLFCSSYPSIVNNIKRGKKFYALTLQTRQLNCFNEIFKLLYRGNNIKTITPDLYDYFNLIVFAHWIMGDGAKKNKGITLCTDSFSFKEVIILMNILKIKYDINTSIHLEKNKPRIYINRLELNKVLAEMKPFFTESMLYKIL